MPCLLMLGALLGFRLRLRSPAGPGLVLRLADIRYDRPDASRVARETASYVMFHKSEKVTKPFAPLCSPSSQLAMT